MTPQTFDSLKFEVEKRADANFDDVIYRMMQQLSSAGHCQRQRTLAAYIKSKILLHRTKKHFEKLDDLYTSDFLTLSEDNYAEKTLDKIQIYHERAEEHRREYYESRCICGTCRSF